jgi:hypothetical protein
MILFRAIKPCGDESLFQSSRERSSASFQNACTLSNIIRVIGGNRNQLLCFRWITFRPSSCSTVSVLLNCLLTHICLLSRRRKTRYLRNVAKYVWKCTASIIRRRVFIVTAFRAWNFTICNSTVCVGLSDKGYRRKQAGAVENTKLCQVRKAGLHSKFALRNYRMHIVISETFRLKTNTEPRADFVRLVGYVLRGASFYEYFGFIFNWISVLIHCFQSTDFIFLLHGRRKDWLHFVTFLWNAICTTQ